MTNINEVVLQGVLVHRFVTPKVAILTINTGNATPISNYPKVVFFGDARDKIDADFHEGDHVRVVGNVQSSKPKPNVKNQITVAVFGETIDKAQSLMEQSFGVSTDNSYKPFCNEMKISGTVVDIEAIAKNIINIKVLVKKNGRTSIVPLVYFTKDGKDKGALLHTIYKRTNICAVGCVQTSKKVINGETKYFENYVATEITKA